MRWAFSLSSKVNGEARRPILLGVMSCPRFWLAGLMSEKPSLKAEDGGITALWTLLGCISPVEGLIADDLGVHGLGPGVEATTSMLGTSARGDSSRSMTDDRSGEAFCSGNLVSDAVDKIDKAGISN